MESMIASTDVVIAIRQVRAVQLPHQVVFQRILLAGLVFEQVAMIVAARDAAWVWRSRQVVVDRVPAGVDLRVRPADAARRGFRRRAFRRLKIGDVFLAVRDLYLEHRDFAEIVVLFESLDSSVCWISVCSSSDDSCSRRIACCSCGVIVRLLPYAQLQALLHRRVVSFRVLTSG